MSKDQPRTTKEMLAAAKQGQTRQPLFNPAAIEALRKDTEKWKAEGVRASDRSSWERMHPTVLGSDIARQLLYSPLAIPDLDYGQDLGLPGAPPFTRGIHANMYRGRNFTMRQLTGFGSPEETNRRIHFMLRHGATGLNVLFDLPTIQMVDSDDPRAAGQVGMSGVCVDSVEDMQRLFEGVPLDEISISIVSHFPSNTAILFSMFLAMAEERGIPWKSLRGSVQNDITLEELVRSGSEFIPPQDCFRIQCDNAQFIRQQVPGWNFITLNGYNLREFGTSAITEMAVALANGIQLLDELQRRGHAADEIADRLAFFWSVANDFFEEIARIRAVRRLWYKIMQVRFGARRQRAMLMRCHVQTSGVCLVQDEPLNNIVRAAYQALAAVLGGAQSLHVDSFDEAYSVPTEEAALLSLRTQQILQAETGITNVVDPLGGSYYLEALTAEMESRILQELDEIERKGGYVQVLESGQLHRRISSYFAEQQRRMEEGEIAVIGHNAYRSSAAPPPLEVFQYPAGVEERQRQRLQELRRRRDHRRVEQALQELLEACRSGENIMPACLQCARARCTEGEMFAVFKEAFGLWKPPALF